MCRDRTKKVQRLGDVIFRARRVVFTLLLALAATSLALFLSEGLVRLIAPQQLIVTRPDVWRAVDGLGWALEREVHTTINTGERTVAVVTDKEGMRVGRSGRPEADFRVLLLGDSFTEAMQVEFEDSFAGLIEARLRPRGGRVAVWNAGVAGHGPNHYLIRAGQMVPEAHWDGVLVIMYAGNDIERRRVDEYAPRAATEVHRFRFPRAATSGELIDTVLYPANDFLEVRSHLFVFLKQRLKTLLMRVGLSAATFDQWYFRSAREDPAWDVTGDIIRDIQVIAAEGETPVLVVLLPSAFQVDPRTFEIFARGVGFDPAAVDPQQPNRLLAERLRDRGLTVVDVLPVMLERFADYGPFHGSVDQHLSPAGHEIVYEILAPALERLLVGMPPIESSSVP